MLRSLVTMCATMTRHKIVVRGCPTEVLCLGQSLQETPQNLVLLIPGNPGVASYYIDTMKNLYEQLGGSHSVWTVSHAGHCLTLPSLWPGHQHVYNLEEQIQHKIAFLEDHLHSKTNLTLVGHSIGCHIILRLLDHFQNNPNISISKTYLLFPTIERMKETPNGTRLWPILCYLRWFVVFLVCAVSLLPQKVADVLLKLYFGSEVGVCSVDATRELLHGRIVQNVLYMAYSELLQVRELDVDRVKRNKDKIMLYYGASDGWCPVKYWKEIQTKVCGVDAVLCEDGVQHAFVLRHSRLVAEKLAYWIKA